jgi:hypothetical protein
MPTSLRLWWRIASLVVVASGIAYLPWLLLLNRDSHSYSKHMFAWYGDVLIFATFSSLSVATVIYVLARTFLVVECFINVRHLPASIFEVPMRSQYFPHIS